MRIGVYPGSFNPPTRAHIEIARAALLVHRLDRLDLAISTVALGKEAADGPGPDERLAVLAASVAGIDGIEAVRTDARLVADIARGYDVVVMGADKWAQVNDPAWYGGDPAARDAAVAALPIPALAPRPPHAVPDHLRLPVTADVVAISSTGARAGRREWMTDAALAAGWWD